MTPFPVESMRHLLALILLNEPDDFTLSDTVLMLHHLLSEASMACIGFGDDWSAVWPAAGTWPARLETARRVDQPMRIPPDAPGLDPEF